MPAIRRRVEAGRSEQQTQSYDQLDVDPTQRAELVVQQVKDLVKSSEEDKKTIVELTARLNEAATQIFELNKQLREGREADRDIKQKQEQDVAQLKEQIKSEVKAEVKAELDARMQRTAAQATEERVKVTEKTIDDKEAAAKRREVIGYIINAIVLAIGGAVVTYCGVGKAPSKTDTTTPTTPTATATARSGLPQPNPNNPAGMPNP